jgi:hypothetical protein
MTCRVMTYKELTHTNAVQGYSENLPLINCEIGFLSLSTLRNFVYL